ncbi:MAG: hypothetical protein IPI06_13995 [Gammaproteobacteria bacterium]|nr:hypothetical protein [Gammaproteobacteria bacterium]
MTDPEVAKATRKASGRGRPPKDSADRGDLVAQQARAAAERADKLALENAVRRGELREAKDVAREFALHVGAARAKLLSIPVKYAPRIATSQDVAEAERMLREAINEALRELVG